MKKSSIAVAALALAGALIFGWSHREERSHSGEEADRAEHAQARSAETKLADVPPQPIQQQATEPSRETEPHAAIAFTREDEYSEEPAKMFKADPAGNLVLHERARLNVEKLSSLYTAEELQQRLAVIEQSLPAGAYRQLVDLMERHKNFTLAARQAFPPGRPVESVEEAISQQEELHGLRVAHFGAEVVEAMFGKEERINRQLMEFMSLEKHAGLTMEEKAIKAQEMLTNSPELAAAYEQNGNSVDSTQSPDGH